MDEWMKWGTDCKHCPFVPSDTGPPRRTALASALSRRNVMSARRGLLGFVAMVLVAGQAAAQSIDQTSFLFRRPATTCPTCDTPVTGQVTVVPTEPNKTDQAPAIDPQAFSQAPASGAERGLSFNPAMFGDLGVSGFAFVNVLVPSNNPFFPTSSVVKVRVPVVEHASFKISDVESPQPSDRVYFNYNFYDRVPVAGASAGLNRELIGFEKTFLGGNASFGMRLPFLQTTGLDGVGGFASHEVGDLTLTSKCAFINDRETGNVLSGGLLLTVPTADHSLILADGRALRDVLIQPYAGWIINRGILFAQGFHAIVVPTDSRDVTQLNNDVAVGLWALRRPDGLVRGIVPTLEGHLFTPLNHQNNADLIFAPDIFTLTAGVTVVLPSNSTVGAAIAAPLTGPRPNNVEALVSVSFRF
jgi:hypothetical protein